MRSRQSAVVVVVVVDISLIGFVHCFYSERRQRQPKA